MVVFHEQVIEMIHVRPVLLRRGRREAPRARDPDGHGRSSRAWFFPRALGAATTWRWSSRSGTVLEAFASFGFCKAHAAAFALPTYQSAWLKAHHPAALPRRGAHPRPGHVPQAPDPRRRPSVRRRRAGARRQRQRIGLRRGARRRRRRRVPEPRDPALPHRRQGHQRRRGGPHRRGARGWPLRVAVRLLPPSPGLPADPRAAGAGRRVRRGLRHRDGRAGPRPTRSDHAARPAAAGRRARPPCASGRPGLADARSRPDQAQRAVDGGHCCDGRCCPQQHRPHGAGRVRVDGAARAGRGGRLGARLGAVEGDAAGGRGRVGPAHAGAG